MSNLKTDLAGNKFWYNDNGQLHREDGPAIEYADGYKTWYLNGKLHREDGPAQEYYNGNKFWYLYGILHREDGPAIELADGSKYWYYHDKEISCKTNEEFLKLIKLKAFW